MTEISRMALFAKLNPVAFQSVEGATVLCKLRGNPVVELAHWVIQILQLDNSDWHCILRAQSLDLARLVADVNRALEKLPSGSNSISDLSDDIPNLVERAWVYASLMFNANSVRTGHLLLALVKTDYLKRALLNLSPLFGRLNLETGIEEFSSLCSESPEHGLNSVQTQVSLPGEASSAMPAAQLGAGQALARYTQDLTARARAGELDTVTGRSVEVRQLVDILLRRRQNNPLITGEAGVGKTAVVEGLALQIASGDVPDVLKNVRLLSLDIGLLQAGASMKGEFEQRLRQVIDEVQMSEQPVVLFIDEVHTLVGAGGAQGTGDAANLLKPALARGALRTVGATTWAEYKKYIEKDPALTRRFQVVQVDEPSEPIATDMLRGLAPTLADHHGVVLLDEAVGAAVSLSHRYIPARQLPDKAVSLLDTACARVAISLRATPAPIEAQRAKLAALQAERQALEAEVALGRNHKDRLQDLTTEQECVEDALNALCAQWANEKECIDVLTRNAADSEAQARLMAVQGETPLMFPRVDAQAVASVVADWTGIPVGRMVKNEIDSILKLADTLSERVIGQNHALELIARRIQTSRARLDDPNKPVGVFMLAGTSGVGKTETALALAESLYGGEHNLVTINMSEYQEAHTVSSLKGAPPGYVGYGEGGVLTEAVRRKPYSVVLLDEVEKAHPDVHELFFQVFDKGVMEDGEGRQIDFRNTLILLTTNVGTDELMHLCRRGNHRPAQDEVAAAIRPALLNVFPPALLGRLDVVPFYPLNDAILAGIVKLQLERIRKRVTLNHRIDMVVQSAVVDLIVARCNESDSGGRVVGSILSNKLLPEISRRLLQASLIGEKIEKLVLSCEDGEFVYEFA